jgi:hypothetical protein
LSRNGITEGKNLMYSQPFEKEGKTGPVSTRGLFVHPEVSSIAQ